MTGREGRFKPSVFVVGVVAGAILMFALNAFAAGGLRIASGVYGVLSGYGNATVVCTDKNGNILNGVTIKSTAIPLKDPSTGATGTGMTFTCP